jgi:hypothetical protein
VRQAGQWTHDRRVVGSDVDGGDERDARHRQGRMIDAVLHDDAPPATVGGQTLLDDVIALAMTVKVIRRYFVNRSATRRGDCLVEDGSGPHKAVLPVRHGRDRPCCLSCCVARRRPRADSSVAAGASIVGPSRRRQFDGVEPTGTPPMSCSMAAATSASPPRTSTSRLRRLQKPRIRGVEVAMPGHDEQ